MTDPLDLIRADPGVSDAFKAALTPTVREVCPVCEGRGETGIIAGNLDIVSTSRCMTCAGRGYILTERAP
jgi:DnaJ-class molecular chaperone